ncbi:MAG TPA: hotdog fold thioesterase [Wenzhouxiangellaceae bacterium]|nr:hotdog fold thioesterase [Wenzhouxiangellaceae bacterium]
MDRQRALEHVNGLLPGTLMETLGIRYTDAGEGFLEAVMPVDSRHHQPMGILHGGATATLAESVASAASGLALAGTGRRPVGLDLTVNHVRSITGGQIKARAEAVHLGRSTHLWQIRIGDDRDRLVAQAKLLIMVLEAAPDTSA